MTISDPQKYNATAMKSKGEIIIEEIWNVVKRVVPNADDKLEFLGSEPFKKIGINKETRVNIIRGKIRGKCTQNHKKHIWDSKWCYYEIGVGFYEEANDPDVRGGVGFVVYPNSASSGGGRHRPRLDQYLKNCVLIDKKLERERGDSAYMTIFKYYRKEFSSFPMTQAATDFSVLISATFKTINSLPR